MVRKQDVLSYDEFQNMVSLVEEQKHVCARQSMAAVADSDKATSDASDDFDKYWSMMGDVASENTLGSLGNEYGETEFGAQDPSSNGIAPADGACEPARGETRPNNWCAACEACTCQETDGYFVCKECGEVGAPCIDSDAEWRVFSKDEQKGDKSRCGEASSTYLSAHSHAEGTVISCKWKESEQMRNARQYHKWNSSHSSGRNLYAIFDELQRHAYKNGFNHMIVEDTKHLYKETTDYHLFRGVNRKGLYAYCLYHTCKKKDVPRSIKEISKIFGLNPHVMTKGHTAFNKVLREHEKLKDRRLKQKKQEQEQQQQGHMSTPSLLSGQGSNLGAAHGSDVDQLQEALANTQLSPVSATDKALPAPSQDWTEKQASRPKPKRRVQTKKCNNGSKIRMLAKPVDFVERFCSQLGLCADITRKVRDVTVNVTEKRLVSDSPSLVTSACILVVFRHCSIDMGSTDVQKISSISHVTIDKCFKKLLVFYDDIVLCM